MNDQRITEIEIKTSFQEKFLLEMNAMILSQSEQIKILQTKVRNLEALVAELSPSPIKPLSEETPPPHY